MFLGLNDFISASSIFIVNSLEILFELSDFFAILSKKCFLFKVVPLHYCCDLFQVQSQFVTIGKNNLIIDLSPVRRFNELFEFPLQDLCLEIILIVLLLVVSQGINGVKQALELVSHDVSLHEFYLDLLLEVSNVV